MTNGLEEILKALGLKKYETAVYVSLIKSGPLTAREVADLAKVPNPRIYSILDTLKKMGYVYEVKSKPSLYDAQHPRHILYTELAKLRKRIDLALEKAEQEYEMRKDQRLIATQDAWTAYGEKGMITELLRLVKTTKREFVAVVRDLDWCLEEGIIKILRSKKGDRVQIRIIGIEPDLIKETADIFTSASGGRVRIMGKSDSSTLFAVADEEEVLISLKKTAMTDRDDYVGVTMRSKSVSRLYHEYFEELWKQIEMEELTQ